MGRRWGKTVLGQCVTLAPASQGAKAAWVVPTYKNGRPLWRAAELAVSGLKKSHLVKVNRSERIIEFSNGGLLALYSMDNPDSIRGEWFHIVVVDEAASIPEDVMQEAIQPTLADADGDLYLIGTPKGRNWFHKEWTRGRTDLTGVQQSWTAPSSANPNPRIQKAAELARSRVPSRTYRQEWLAEFLEGEGLVFRGIAECATAPLNVQPYPGTFVMGVDWGRSDDYTVLTVMDVLSRQVVEIDRFNQVGWTLQRRRLINLHEKWNCAAILAEENSIGNPNIEALQRGEPTAEERSSGNYIQQNRIPIRGWTATNSTKSELIEDLVLAIENKAIGYPNDPVLIAELEAYEQTKLPSGVIRYSAPEGMHDDTVISLGLAYRAAQHGITRRHGALYR